MTYFLFFHLQQVICEIGKRPFSYFRLTEPTNRKTEKDNSFVLYCSVVIIVVTMIHGPSS